MAFLGIFSFEGSPQLNHFTPSPYWLTPENPQFRDIHWQQRMQQQQQQQQQQPYGNNAQQSYNQLASPILSHTPKSSPPLVQTAIISTVLHEQQFNATNPSYYDFTPPKDTSHLMPIKTSLDTSVKTEHNVSPSSMTDEVADEDNSGNEDDVDGDDGYEEIDDDMGGVDADDDDDDDYETDSKGFSGWSPLTGGNATVPQHSDRLSGKLKKKPTPGSYPEKISFFYCPHNQH